MPYARWPNANLTAGGEASLPGGPLSKTSWCKTSASTRLRDGVVACDGLNATGVDWTGAVATLNVGYRFLTWTRRVTAYYPGNGSFAYNSLCSTTGKVGGRGSYLDKAADNLVFLSGVLGALDAPGEWFIDEASWTLYAWMPDSGAPAGRVRLKTRDYCLDVAPTHPVHLANVSMRGCTFRLQNCSGCSVDAVSLSFPTHARELLSREVVEGPSPAVTLLAGSHSTVTRLHLRYATAAGLKIVGDNNTVRDCLLEDNGWLPSIDYSPIQLGFGSGLPTLDAQRATGHNAALGGHEGGTQGNDNRVERVTIRRFGECGILTSQRSNEISYSHVYHGGLTGLDSAGIHADNTYVSCMNWTLPPDRRANCTKVWHHNWVHDCREKCMRGDDGNLNLTTHHNVLFNCGVASEADRNDPHASTGFIVKGEYNQYWANTIFNSDPTGQGDLCAVTSPLHGHYVSPRRGVFPSCALAAYSCLAQPCRPRHLYVSQ